MVSSTNVKSNKETIDKAVNNTSTAIDGMRGEWEGKSYTNLRQRFRYFKEGIKNFDTDMDTFAEALDLYKKYLEKKEEINNEIEKLNNYGDDQAEDKKRCRHRINYKKGELEDIGKEILPSQFFQRLPELGLEYYHDSYDGDTEYPLYNPQDRRHV